LNVEKARQKQVWVGEGFKSPAGGGKDKKIGPEKMILFDQDDFKDF
jgi:hypothetical protein